MLDFRFQNKLESFLLIGFSILSGVVIYIGLTFQQYSGKTYIPMAFLIFGYYICNRILAKRKLFEIESIICFNNEVKFLKYDKKAKPIQIPIDSLIVEISNERMKFTNKNTLEVIGFAKRFDLVKKEEWFELINLFEIYKEQI